MSISAGKQDRGRGTGSTFRRRGAGALALLLLAPAAFAGSWWNDDWKFRKEISFDLSPSGADVAATVQDAPVLVRLSLANFNYFGDAKPDGADFRVLAADDKTPLKFHFERYDAQAQMAFLWVHVPQLSGGAKTDKIFVYYGNPGAAAAADPAGTYDANQTLVLHFGEAAGAAPADATAYKNNATASEASAIPGSLIGGGLRLASGRRPTVPASASLRLLPAQGFTTSAWVKPDGAGGEQIVLALTDAGKQLSLGLAAARPFARFSAGSAPVSVMAPAELASGGWHHLAVTAGGGQLRLYVDGEPVAGGAVALAEIGGVFSIGSDAQGGSAFAGEIDEVEAAKVARPAEWFRVAVKSQGLDSPLVVYGGDAQKEGGGTSYFGTILKNLTVDGWVVIGICLAMLAVAIVVMVMKALYLGRVERANRRFLEQFRREPAEQRIGRSDGGGPAALGPELTAGSTLYELYRVASDELAKRLAYAKPGGDRSVSAQSVEAIRASVDATSTRMQQQLSARMVLLTIAISGGPFLGLLGTVIGVMITFAAIAASGDVNVNAIAPGTAAALAATVAGLSVAIPSLFGYNWLNSRIKAINADQRVFADELIAQIAERHS